MLTKRSPLYSMGFFFIRQDQSRTSRTQENVNLFSRREDRFFLFGQVVSCDSLLHWKKLRTSTSVIELVHKIRYRGDVCVATFMNF